MNEWEQDIALSLYGPEDICLEAKVEEHNLEVEVNPKFDHVCRMSKVFEQLKFVLDLKDKFKEHDIMESYYKENKYKVIDKLDSKHLWILNRFLGSPNSPYKEPFRKFLCKNKFSGLNYIADLSEINKVFDIFLAYVKQYDDRLRIQMIRNNMTNNLIDFI